MGILNIEPAKTKAKNLIISSSIHGLSNSLRSDTKYSKFFWLILFLASSSIAIKTVIENVQQFLDYEVITKIDIVDEFKSRFPAVTFYNLNAPTANFSLNDIMIDCYFNNEICNETDFDKVVDKFGFISYRLKPKEVYFAGKLYGLDVILFNKKSLNKNERRTNGFEIVVHNYSFDPGYYSGYSNDAMNISPGLATNLIVNRVFSYKLSKPYNNCFKENETDDLYQSDLLKYILNSQKYSYRQKECIDYCISQEFISHFNVSIPLDSFTNVFLTLIKKYNITQNSLKIFYYDLIKSKINDICVEKCPIECDSIKYEITTSISKFPNEDYANVLMRNEKIKSLFPSNHTITFNDLENNLIYFRVYFRDLKYTKIFQLPKATLFEFVSSLGGVLGLFIGVSFLSFAELFEILFEVLLILFNLKKTNIEPF